ncbi:MAG: CocE/NonD family hydrolase [bacterium]
MKTTPSITLLGVFLLLGGAGCGDSGAGQSDAGQDAGVQDAGGDAASDADGAAPDCTEHTQEELLVPLSDGQSLSAFARRPVNPECLLPTILVQTPYNKENARAMWFGATAPGPLFESLDYAFVVVDWRGFFGSAGAVVAQPDYGADGYDVVEWIAEQAWSDGQVGTWGVSALGRVQYWTAVRRPPHLRASVPIFNPMNTLYEEYYPGGVLRREFVDTLGLLYGQSVVEQHPLRDAVWIWLEGLYRPSDINVPMLVVAGWYDLDNARSFRAWDSLVTASDPTVRDRHRMLVGAWHHFAAGGETTGAGRPLTTQELLYHDGEFRIQTDSLAWFDHHLRGADPTVSTWAPIRYVRDGESAWEEAGAWPPTDTQDLTLHLHADGSLDETPAVAGELSYPFDPADPSPTIGGQTLDFTLLHGPTDQADVLLRNDVLAFTTAPLTAALRVRGPITVRLAAATTGADTDFVVRLTDVDAAGGHLLLTDGVRRLSLRDTLSTASPVTPGSRYELDVPFTNQLAYTFAAGHRVGLIVSSSSHPRFERNPGNGDSFYTDPSTAVAVTNTVYLDGVSRLVLPAD